MPLRWAKSQQVERDNNDRRADGAQCAFYLAGTTTALTVYQDASLTTPHGSTVTATSGRWPTVFIPFSTTDYKEVASTSGGTNLWTMDNLDRADPVTAAASTVDATQLLQTGDWVFAPVDEVRAGFVRANGRTIGSATSSPAATERANDDTVNLFTYLWNKTANAQCAVSGGRGATAAADFAANKTITLPDCRGGGPFGLTTMGNSDGANMGSTVFSNGNATTPCSLGGSNSHTLITGEVPSHTHAGTTNGGGDHNHGGLVGAGGDHNHGGLVGSGGAHTHTITDLGHTHTTSTFLIDAGTNGATTGTAHHSTSTGSGTGSSTTGISINSGGAHDHSISASGTHDHAISSSGTHTHTFTTDAAGGGTAHNNVSKVIMGTWYVKL